MRDGKRLFVRSSLAELCCFDSSACIFLPVRRLEICVRLMGSCSLGKTRDSSTTKSSGREHLIKE
jgi:hypothetical protein